MTRRLVCLLLALASCAPRGSTPPPRAANPGPLTAPPAPDAGPAALPGGFVLVHSAADLYLAPRSDAPRLNPYASPDQARAGLVASVHRLVGEQDGWLSLETLPEGGWDRHCAGALTETKGLALRVFARVSDRVAVTAREIRMGYRDGTAVTLAAGTPLWPKLPSGSFRVVDGGLAFSVNPPKHAVGISYDPSPKFLPPKEWTRLLPHSRLSDLRYGESATVSLLHPAAAAMVVADEKAVPGGVLVTIPLGCTKLEARAPTGAVEGVGGLLGDLLATGSSPPGPSARKGAPVHWPGGERAGTAVEQYAFTREIAPESGKRCFERALRYVSPKEVAPIDERNLLRLCLAAEDVVPTAKPEPKPEETAPLTVKGARRCNPEELEREWCAEGKRAGVCREGWCVTAARCPSYCAALADRETAATCQVEPVPDCAKKAECVKHERELRNTCEKIRRERLGFCKDHVCSEISKMPAPP